MQNNNGNPNLLPTNFPICLFYSGCKDFVLSSKYLNSIHISANYTSTTMAKTLVEDGDKSDATPHILFVRPWSGLHCTLTPTCNTHLSPAFHLRHNMSRVFKGQKARHKQRKCKASKPLSRCSSALWSNTFAIFACFFSFALIFSCRKMSTGLATHVAVTDGWRRAVAVDMEPSCCRARGLKCGFFWGQLRSKPMLFYRID